MSYPLYPLHQIKYKFIQSLRPLTLEEIQEKAMKSEADHLHADHYCEIEEMTKASTVDQLTAIITGSLKSEKNSHHKITTVINALLLEIEKAPQLARRELKLELLKHALTLIPEHFIYGIDKTMSEPLQLHQLNNRNLAGLLTWKGRLHLSEPFMKRIEELIAYKESLVKKGVPTPMWE